MVTKSLRAEYADPARIAHKALADRITARDPGNAPAAGDRIGYVYISAKAGQLASKLQGERIETPQFIKDNSLLPDYRHYIEHQLQNPISQAFGLLLEQIPGFTQELVKGCPLLSENLDKYLAFREAKAAELLFGDCLKRFEITSKRTAMFSMFGSNATITSKPRNVIVQPADINTTDNKQVTQVKQVQKSISSFLYDSFLVSNIKKKDRAIATAKKKTKEDVMDES